MRKSRLNSGLKNSFYGTNGKNLNIDWILNTIRKWLLFLGVGNGTVVIWRISIFFFFFLMFYPSNLYTQHGAYNPEIESHTLPTEWARHPKNIYFLRRYMLKYFEVNIIVTAFRKLSKSIHMYICIKNNKANMHGHW